MNTTPAEETLALWMEGELAGPQLAAVEAWAASHPELLAEREALGEWKSTLRALIPADEQPAYPDFFNSRIQRSLVEEPTVALRPAPAPARIGWWRSLVVPGMAAGMALCFWLGTQVNDRPPTTVTVVATKEPPVIYTPAQGVTAEIVTTADGEIIVLEGLAAMPDSLEIPENARLPEQGSLRMIKNPNLASF
jgi:hypothetical protein